MRLLAKRTLLSDYFRQFTKPLDPVGWLAPIINSYKLLLQNVLIEGIDWDPPVSQAIETEWLRARNGYRC